jgi:hypothetical protein
VSRLAGQRTKGSAIRSTLEFVELEFGPETGHAVLARLSEQDRERVRTQVATEEAPYALLRRVWEAADAEIGERDPGWAERSGAFAIRSTGMQLYRGIVSKDSPLQFLEQPVSLFRLYYSPGNIEVVQSEGGSAIVRLVGFDPETPLFCRRQTGGLAQVVSLAGGQEIESAHVRCSLVGDAFCEWRLRWTAGTGELPDQPAGRVSASKGR